MDILTAEDRAARDGVDTDEVNRIEAACDIIDPVAVAMNHALMATERAIASLARPRGVAALMYVDPKERAERQAVAALLRRHFANRRTYLAMFVVGTSALTQPQRQRLMEWILKW